MQYLQLGSYQQAGIRRSHATCSWQSDVTKCDIDQFVYMSEQKDKSTDEFVDRERTDDKKREGARKENYELPSEGKVKEELMEGVE
jgi:hypothetical protein